MVAAHMVDAMNWDPERTYQELLEFIRTGSPTALDPEEAERLERTSGVLDNAPMLCRGPECEFAARCPYSNRHDFIGTHCILETYEAYRHFSSYIRSLGITSQDTTDIQMVSDLVRLHILSWRIDQKLAIEGMTQNNETISGNRVSITRAAHPLLAEQRALIKSRESLYDKLLASRKARAEIEAKRKGSRSDLVRILYEMSRQIPQNVVAGELVDGGGYDGEATADKDSEAY